MGDRVILHCDMNSFFASVELLDHPELKDKPVAVCGDPESRHGIILAKNELAKKAGVATAETVWQVRKKCPDIVFLPAHYNKYSHYSRLINNIYKQYTDQVEPFSIDESWLDVTASFKLFGTGRRIADEIRERVKSELGLTLSAGVSYNKVFAKMGSEYKKPDATTEITRENFKELLWPLPINELFFSGRATSKKLREVGISTIGDLAASDPELLQRLIGKQGPLLRDYALGLDDSPVLPGDYRRKIKSVGNGITFRRNLVSEYDITTALTALSDTVASRLRSYGLKAGGVKVDIRDAYFNDISRQTQLSIPVDTATAIKATALEIIKKNWHIGSPIRQITVTGINLTDSDAEEQISFFGSSPEVPAEQRQKDHAAEQAMDDIRKKFGSNSIVFGQILTNDIGIDF